MKILKLAFLLIIIFLFDFKSFAQLQLHPLNRNYLKGNKTSQVSRTGHEIKTLLPPFFDDFSYSNIQADTNKWVFNEVVLISNSYAKSPPTHGAAIFDGLNLYGQAYDLGNNSIGYADSLESHYIDISTLNPNHNTQLTFYWNGNLGIEEPDKEERDSLIVQFRDVNEVWRTVWPDSAKYQEIFQNLEDTFIQDTIVIEPEFFHEKFQFRFMNHGRLSGGYDIWGIDYVVLSNDSLNGLGTTFEFALSEQPTQIFKNYSSIPLEQFLIDPDTLFADTVLTRVNNLSEGDAPLGSNAKAFMNGVEINNDLFIRLHNVSSSDPSTSHLYSPFAPFDPDFPHTRQLRVAKITDFNKQVSNAGFDTLSLIGLGKIDISFQIVIENSFTNLLYEVDRNDTIYSHNEIADYFSYDDGTAEYGISHRQKFGKVAYEYETIVPDTLTAIDMYITQLEVNLAGQVFDLIVWQSIDNGDNTEDVELLRQSVDFNDYFYANNINEFSRIPLIDSVYIGRNASGVATSNTFYIGYEQQEDTPITIGFDKNNNSDSKIFSNLSANWVGSQVNGSLMIRPVFGNVEITTGLEKGVNNKLTVYPNPATEKINIKGKVERVHLYTINGRKILENKFNKQENKSIDLSNVKPGLYYLRLFNDNSVVTKKIIIKN